VRHVARMGEMRNVYVSLVRKRGTKTQSVKFRRRCFDNIKRYHGID
jgi:hypothetical protein